MSVPNREEAMILLKKYNQNESLINHALAVEGVMRHFAELNNEDVEFGGLSGFCMIWIMKNFLMNIA